MPTFLLPVKLCSDYDFKDVTFQKKKKNLNTKKTQTRNKNPKVLPSINKNYSANNDKNQGGRDPEKS